MIDDAIEAHLRGLLAQAYPGVTEDQVLVLFPSAVLDFGTGYRRAPGGGGHIIGTETITVNVIVATDEKLDRLALIRLLKRQNVELTENDYTWTAFQEYRRCQHREYMEAIGMKGTMFAIEYTHGIS